MCVYVLLYVKGKKDWLNEDYRRHVCLYPQKVNYIDERHEHLLTFIIATLFYVVAIVISCVEGARRRGIKFNSL